MKHFPTKSLAQSIAKLDSLMGKYTGTAPHYKVSVIKVDKVSQYHVVNIGTNITQSHWKTLDKAMEVMRDLNRMAKKVA